MGKRHARQGLCEFILPAGGFVRYLAGLIVQELQEFNQRPESLDVGLTSPLRHTGFSVVCQRLQTHMFCANKPAACFAVNLLDAPVFC